MIPIAGLPTFVLFLLLLFSQSLAALLPFDLFRHDKKDHRTQHHQPVMASPEPDLLEDVLDSLAIMQEEYFEHWQGTWPSAIDWTAAVMQTILTGTLKSLSDTLNSPDFDAATWKLKENLVDNFFGQVVGSYFGQNALSIREQAYDDMLWVVLGWLEAIQFVDEHSEQHYGPRPLGAKMSDRVGEILANASWHGNNWIPSFAHRSRIFWDISNRGWDTRLCGGGMVWNPRLSPYKNAITNELYISASIKMYLYFPGDSITSPFGDSAYCSPPGGKDGDDNDGSQSPLPPCPPRDAKFLAAAVDGYKWLLSSGMMNKHGLFADGFHISGLKDGGTKCDVLDEMVYTYNQGVLLSGCRGLFQVTGASSYLEDCHQLVRNVIYATGWDILRAEPIDDISAPGGWLPPWHGLGRVGVLEEKCDSIAKCTQNGQTFKGIFFHHLIEFCSPFSESAIGHLKADSDPAAIIEMHRQACISYAPWVNHNARAAMLTRNAKGKFGMWWTAGLLGWDVAVDESEEALNDGWVDYRNYGLPNDGLWQEKDIPPQWTPEGGNTGVPRFDWFDIEGDGDGPSIRPVDSDNKQQVLRRRSQALGQCVRGCGDPNERGRGRTVETQAGGVSVLRAAWEFAKL